MTIVVIPSVRRIYFYKTDLGFVAREEFSSYLIH